MIASGEKPPFAPDQRDDQEVEDREQHQAGGVGRGEAVELVGDEERHHHQRGRISPAPAVQQAGDHRQLHQAVDQQVGGAEVLGLHREALRPVQQRGGDAVAGIGDDAGLGDAGDRVQDGGGADQEQQQAAGRLQRRDGALEQQADLEGLVQQAVEPAAAGGRGGGGGSHSPR